MKKSEILFRGKVNDNWEYFGIDNKNVPDVELNQWIGYEDSNHNKIFEGDVVEFTLRSGSTIKYLVWLMKEGNDRRAFLLKYFDIKYEIGFNGHDYFNSPDLTNYSDFIFMLLDPYCDVEKISVLGNVYDNQELLKDYMKDRVMV